MIKFIVLFFITNISLAQDISLRVSDRSVKLWDLLLPEITHFFQDFCLKDLPPVEKQKMGIKLIITPKLVCIDSIKINIESIKSLEIIDQNTISISIPEFSVAAHMEETVSLNGHVYEGKSKLATTEMGIDYTVKFFKDDENHLRLDIVSFNLTYDKLNIDFDNKWIENAYYYLFNYDFVKNLIINNIVFPQIKVQAATLMLENFLEIPINDKKFVLGLYKLPIFFESDERYLLADFIFEEKEEFLKKQSKIIVKRKNEVGNKIIVEKKINLIKEKKVITEKKVNILGGEVPNFSVQIKTSVFQKISLAFKDKLKINLNSFDLIEKYLTVKNLSVLFPGLNSIYKNPDEKIDLDVEIKSINDNFLIQRKYNLFLFTDLKLILKNNLSKENICDFNIKNYLNLRYSSSENNKNVFYFNQPEMRIKKFYSDKCDFEYNNENYTDLFQNLLDMKLLSVNKLDYSIISDVLEGPFIYLKEEFFLFGFDLKIDI